MLFDGGLRLAREYKLRVLAMPSSRCGLASHWALELDEGESAEAALPARAAAEIWMLIVALISAVVLLVWMDFS